MDDSKASIARTCLDGAETGAMNFPQIVDTLVREGFEGYLVDFRQATATYYLSDGGGITLPTHKLDVALAAAFDPAPIQAAIRDAQLLVPGYSYGGFCRRVASAGCAGYLVSFPGRRALYFGRTAETHLEPFPD